MQKDSYAFLEALLETPSPSGFEHDGQRLWLDRVTPFADRAWNDAYGNCFAEIGASGASDAVTVAICGHADEIGLMVNHFDDKGFIYCRQIGGIDPATVVGKRVRFRSSVPGVEGLVDGVIGATAIHLQEKGGDPKVRKLHELFIDIGVADRAAAEARLNIGDPGTFADGVMRIGDDILVARGLDNRIGTWVAAETLRQLAAKREGLNCRVVAVSTVQEEIGLNGAAMIADSLRPDVALVTDVGHATDSPGINQAQHGQYRLGGGPKVALGASMHRGVTAALLKAAQDAGITIQRAATPGKSGTDTDAIFLRNGGIPSGLVSLPIRYMHTTVEMASLADLQAIADLYTSFCMAIGDGERFASPIG